MPSILAKRFKALTFDDFYQLLAKVFLVLLQLQRRIAFLNELIISGLKEMESRGIAIGYDNFVAKEALQSPTSPIQLTSSVDTNSAPATKYSQLILETSDILFATSDLAHVRCGKLLTLRAEQNSQLNFKDFRKLFEMTWIFVNVGEWICQRSCIGLRGTLMTQVYS